jgi:hypothetical protein
LPVIRAGSRDERHRKSTQKAPERRDERAAAHLKRAGAAGAVQPRGGVNRVFLSVSLAVAGRTPGQAPGARHPRRGFSRADLSKKDVYGGKGKEHV